MIFVLLIISISIIGGIMKERFARDDRRKRDIAGHDDVETRRLKEEVSALKERLQVLERITIEKESSLNREIEQLRDRT
jgi:hypothetical protein